MPLSQAQVDGNERYFNNVFRSVAGASVGDVIEYTISLYSTMEESNPLATFTGNVGVVDPAEITSSVKKIRGNAGETIPFDVRVKGGSFTGRPNITLRISNNNSSKYEITSTDGRLQSEYNGWRIQLDELADEAVYSFELRVNQEVNDNFYVSLRENIEGIDEDIELPNGLRIPVQIPYLVAEEDVKGLQAIADANSSQALKDYVANKGWLSQGDESYNDTIYTRWDENEVPARLIGLSLNNLKEGLTTLDVSSFGALQSLGIQDCDVASLDLTSLGKLNSLSIYNTKIGSYSDVKLPENPDLSIWGRMNTKEIGTPVVGQEDYLCEIVAGDTVDLSEYTALEGAKFTWYEDSYTHQEITLEQTSPGVFVLPPVTGDNVTYSCEISTTKYPDWIYATKQIRLTRGAIDYSQDDIQLLKALAAANPDCVELQQFITAEGWTETWAEYWLDQNRKVAVDWNDETPARISKLRVRNLNTVKSFDISGFTELEYLDCEQLGLKQLLLSGNTKLQTLMAGYNIDMPTLDLSKNTNLHTLDIPGCRTLSRLDLSKCNSLTYLDISTCAGLSDVDLTGVPLTTLRMNYTSGLEDLVKNHPATVQSLYYAGTDYPALDLSEYSSLVGYGVPRQVTELDITNTNIRDLGVDDSGLKYSTLKAKDGIYVGGGTLYPVPGLVKNEYDEYVIQNGDTIDLSSEAMIGGVASVYTWVKTEGRVEANDAFRQVEGKPGVFVANGVLGKSYFCIIANEKYVREGWTISSWSGWRLETYRMCLQLPEATYDTTEVAALEAIVDGCASPSLKAWWDSEAWKNGYYPEDWRFNAWWHLDEETNTYHLFELQLNSLQDTLSTLDVSAFKELILLSCDNSGLETLSVAGNARLKSLYCGYSPKLATLTLPTNKTDLENLQCDGCTKLETLDVAGYTNLIVLSVRSCKFRSLELSQLANLEYLWCNGTDLTVNVSNHPKLREYGVPRNVESFDMNKLDSLQILDPSNSKLKFSTVTLKEGQPWFGGYSWNCLPIEGFRSYALGKIYYLVPAGKLIDLSSEMKINGKASEVKWFGYDRETFAEKAVQVTGTDGKFTVSGRAKDKFEAIITNEAFNGWEMSVMGEFYTRDGDANLDDKVDVRDIATTVNWVINDTANVLPDYDFGWYEADVNTDDKIDVADITGIANLIMGKPVTKSNGLRSDFVPTVNLTAEEGFLCMETDVPVAGVQLALTGMAKAEPLLGKAAKLTQASHADDTLRMLAYSLKGETIPAGKTVLMKWPEGARLAGAAFSDSQARSLKVETRGDIATSNATISVTASSKEIRNYPNPFRGTTTLVYRLDEDVDNAFIQVYALNGALVEVVEGLSTQAGENRFVYSTRLTGGTYVYRLVTRKGVSTNYSKSNTFIIK
ncbi:T9SS type A sorting domain-containing protein [Parabacteroides sp.]